jgi:RimJ/RimL family protein N-acetyltransferase
LGKKRNTNFIFFRRKKILSFAFQTLGLIEIKAGYDKKNLASAKLFEKCNFVITKTSKRLMPNSEKKKVIVNVSKKNI